MEDWCADFMKIANLNEWGYDRFLKNLRFLTAPDYHSSFSQCLSIKEALTNFKMNLFPRKDFHKYKKEINKTYSVQFETVNEYFLETRRFTRKMDNCLDEKEKLSNRETLSFFYQGLSTHQKRLIVDLDIEDPFEIAYILDKRKLLAQEIGLHLNEQFNKISLNKWERTPSRDKTFKPQRKLFPRNLEKKDKTNFIFEKPDNKIKRLILLGKVNGKTNKILLDTG